MSNLILVILASMKITAGLLATFIGAGLILCLLVCLKVYPFSAEYKEFNQSFNHWGEIKCIRPTRFTKLSLKKLSLL